MENRSKIAEGFAPLVDLIYPPRCPLCGDGIGRHGGLCLSCWSELEIPSGIACSGCGRPFASEEMGENARCAPCLFNPPRHSGISAGTIYNDASRKLILAFKHGGKLGLAPMLARLMAARLPETDECARDPLLVPVPLHRWRLWSRGFNQAAILARELERAGRGELAVDLLCRDKNTPSLGGLGKKARRNALAGAVSVNPRRERLLKGRDVILVDDVLTSGATTDRCVSVLLRGGANSVHIACFARVIDSLEMGAGTQISTARPILESETPEA